MGSVLDKVKKFGKTRTRYTGGGGDVRRFTNLFLDWEDGDNHVRLVGEFIPVRTHYIRPDKRRGNRGLCPKSAFSGDDRLPALINCLDWDLEKEEPAEEKTCPICRLNRLANHFLQNRSADLSDKEKDFFENLRQVTRPREAVKWNVIDRDDCHITEVKEDGSEERVDGYKIATFGMMAYDDIEKIFADCGFDITDPERGVDLCVTKSQKGGRTTYGTKLVLAGKGADMKVKVTPLTEEELKYELHDVKRICGRMVEVQALVDNMHDDLRELLDLTDDEESPADVKTASIAKDDKGEGDEDEDEDEDEAEDEAEDEDETEEEAEDEDEEKIASKKSKKAKSRRSQDEDEDDEDYDDDEDYEDTEYGCMGKYLEDDESCKNCGRAEECKKLTRKNRKLGKK